MKVNVLKNRSNLCISKINVGIMIKYGFSFLNYLIVLAKKAGLHSFKLMKFPAVRRIQPIGGPNSSSTHVHLLRWSHGNQQEQ